MPFTRVQLSFPYFTNIPEDVSTNTLYFGHEFELDASAWLSLQTVVYNGVAEFGGRLSSVVGANVLMTPYRMEDPEPRVPAFPTVSAPLPTHSGAGMPEEVAACLSYRTTYTSGVDNRSRRGRIYIGPLSTACFDNGSSTAFSRVNSATIADLIDAAEVWAESSELYTWCIHSRVQNAFYPIIECWVDNSPDTQRRRGHRPTIRTVEPLDPA